MASGGRAIYPCRVGSAPQVDWLPQRAHGFPGRLGLTCAPGGWRLGAYPDDLAQLDEDLRAVARIHGATALVTLLLAYRILQSGAARGWARSHT